MNVDDLLVLSKKELRKLSKPIVIDIPTPIEIMSNRWEVVEPIFKRELLFAQKHDLIPKKWTLDEIKKGNRSWSAFEGDVVKAIKDNSLPTGKHNGELSPFQALLTLYCYSPRIRRFSLKVGLSREKEVVYIVHENDKAYVFIISRARMNKLKNQATL